MTLFLIATLSIVFQSGLNVALRVVEVSFQCKKLQSEILLLQSTILTDPLFRKYKILKFRDLNSNAAGTFMFNLAMGLHPPQICDLFTKNENFDRNLNFKLNKLPFVYLEKLVPHSLAKSLNSLNIAQKTGSRKNLQSKRSQLMPPFNMSPRVKITS